MERVSVLVYVKGNLEDEFIQGLLANKEFIGEVIFSSFEENNLLREFPFESKSLNFAKEVNKAKIRNALLESAGNDLVLYLSNDTILEDEFIKELLEEFESSRSDIVYPNVILKSGEKEKVLNFEDLYNRETNLLSSLSAENCLPEWGFLALKSKLKSLGGFNEYFKDYEFYEFIYKNIKSLNLKLSELSYVTQVVKNTFIDTSFRSYAIREIVLKRYDWKKEIFPFLSWEEKPEIARSTALTIIGLRLNSYYDFFNASSYFREALLLFHNQETLKQLIKTYVNMGMFEEAKNLLSDVHGVDKEEQEKVIFFIDKISLIIDELEMGIKEGKLLEVITALQEVAEIYEGAPIHNILGVIKWMEKDLENAYKFFFKAVTMNPINKDYLYNLIEAAKILKKEEDVKELVSRIIGK